MFLSDPQPVHPEGERIGHIRLPETTSNLVFGGPKRNRLMMTASQSIYAIYINTLGAHITSYGIHLIGAP